MCKKKELWFDEKESDYFLIPSHVKMKSGDFLIKNHSKEEKRVLKSGVVSFLITKDEADDWLKDQLRFVVVQLKTGLKEIIFKSSPKNIDESNQYRVDPDKESKTTTTTPGLDLLADITNTSRESMDDNYSAIGQALKTYLKDVTSTVTDGVSGESGRQESARERMKSWGNTLQEHGIKAPDIKGHDEDNEQESDLHERKKKQD